MWVHALYKNMSLFHGCLNHQINYIFAVWSETIYDSFQIYAFQHLEGHMLYF